MLHLNNCQKWVERKIHPESFLQKIKRYLVGRLAYTTWLSIRTSIIYKALRVADGSARYARSQGKNGLERQMYGSTYSRWSNILGANRRLANTKSSMLQENNPDAACMYVHTYFDT